MDAKDLWGSFKNQFHERVSSPLIFSFIVSWIIWNHRVLVVLFADLPVEDRFNFIDTVLYPSESTLIVKGGLLPLGCALLYIFVYPQVAKIINKYWLKQQVKLNDDKNRIEKAELLTREQMDAERKRSNQMVIETREENGRLQDELELRKQEVSDLRKRLSADRSEAVAQAKAEMAAETSRMLATMRGNEIKSDVIPESCRQVLKILAGHDGQTLAENVFSAIEESRVAVEHYIDLLTADKYVASTTDQKGSRKLRLTDKGRAFVVSEKLI